MNEDDEKTGNFICENVYIGHFIFTLGIEYALLNNSKPQNYAAVNLYQGGADRHWADLFTSFEGRCLLIEFKATRQLDDRENIKLDNLRTRINSSGNQIEWTKLSHQCHYFGYGIPSSENREASLSLCHYLDADNASQTMPLNGFARATIQGEKGLPPKKFAEYCRFLKETRSIKTSSSGAGLMMMRGENGKITTVSAPSLDLLLEKVSEYAHKIEPPPPPPENTLTNSLWSSPTP